MFNKIVMVGHLTRDIEMRYTQGGLAVANTALATSRKFKSPAGEQKEETCFVDITFFARSAEIANQYIRKGSKILIEGRLNFEQWKDQNGANRSKHTIVVENMQMLDSKNSYEPIINGAIGKKDVYGGQQVNVNSVNNIEPIDFDEEVVPF